MADEPAPKTTKAAAAAAPEEVQPPSRISSNATITELPPEDPDEVPQPGIRHEEELLQP